MYKVKESDLKGQIKDFPIEVVQRMVECQVEQGNKADVGIFQICTYTAYDNGGFYWCKTKEGPNFWVDVIMNKRFDLFFEKYPKNLTDRKE